MLTEQKIKIVQAPNEQALGARAPLSLTPEITTNFPPSQTYD